jgi:hypothetical protein
MGIPCKTAFNPTRLIISSNITTMCGDTLTKNIANVA